MERKKERIAALLLTVLLAIVLSSSLVEAVTYQYDTQNRLIRARFDDGTVVEYTYDKAGNRYTKTLDFSGNHPPVAQDQAVVTAENNPVVITLVATDQDNDPLTYLLEADPGHGVLTGTAPNFTYQPATQYDGSDIFSFKVNDGEDDSAIATVSITITNVNLLPIAHEQCLSTREDTALAIHLDADDPDTQPLPLVYSIVDNPANGILSGTPPNVAYTPNPGFEGHDVFTFKVFDGIDDSPTAAVAVNIETWSPVVWIDAVGVIVKGNTLTKCAQAGWGNSGAASDQVMYGDGALEVKGERMGVKSLILTF